MVKDDKLPPSQVYLYEPVGVALVSSSYATMQTLVGLPATAMMSPAQDFSL
jgi:hypothetical protein